MGLCRIIARKLLGSLLLLALIPSCTKREAPAPAMPTPTATPIPFISRKPYETARLFNGITLKSSVQSTPSESTALTLEAEPDNYTLKLELHLQIPKPATSISDLLAATPELGFLLPNFDQLVTNATISPDFAKLFSNKEKRLRANLGSLERLLPLDTLYDCQTILNVQNPQNSRRALLIQALMNVNADGSDGDRNLSVDYHSAFYQPQTNYRWPKATEHPNPCLHDTELRLAAIKEKLNSPTLSAAEKSRLLADSSETKDTLAELKTLSFLVGTADPFIVLPSFMFGEEKDHPEIGDYAIVIAENTLYPAIVGDKGPNFKMGEASLRLCREIDETSTADVRPVDHPSVTYLIFPGTAEKPFSSPDYKHWSDRCHALWKEFSGSEKADWHEWESLEKPWPTPTPLPTPLPTVSATPMPTSETNLTSGMNPAVVPLPTLNSTPTNFAPLPAP